MRIVNRPTWQPKTDEQQQALDEAIAAARAADEAEAKAWLAIERALALRVPADVLAKRANRSRSTMYRRFGPKSGS